MQILGFANADFHLFFQGGPEIEQRIQNLEQNWEDLKSRAGERGSKLDQSLAYQQFIAKVDEEEAWIGEKANLMQVLLS